MRTYKNVLNELTTVLDDAVNLALDSESLKDKLAHIDVNALVDLSNAATKSGDEDLHKKLTELSLFADETGNRRREILALTKPKYEKGIYSTKHKDILSTFCRSSACSFLFLQPDAKYLHCYFIIDNDENKVSSVTFNETLYNKKDPVSIGSISIMDDLERGLKTLTEYE